MVFFWRLFRLRYHYLSNSKKNWCKYGKAIFQTSKSDMTTIFIEWRIKRNPFTAFMLKYPIQPIRHLSLSFLLTHTVRPKFAEYFFSSQLNLTPRISFFLLKKRKEKKRIVEHRMVFQTFVKSFVSLKWKIIKISKYFAFFVTLGLLFCFETAHRQWY